MRLGLRTVIASDPVPQYLGKYSLTEFWQRHVRWGRIRKAQAPLAFLVEPALGCMISGAIGALAAARYLGIHPQEFFLAHLFVWSACDALVMRKLKNRISVSTTLAWFLREVLAFPLWFNIALGNTVDWRGRRFSVR